MEIVIAFILLFENFVYFKWKFEKPGGHAPLPPAPLGSATWTRVNIQVFMKKFHAHTYT